MPTLDWIGKDAVVGHHHKVPYRLLHCDPKLSAGDPDAGNLLVQGDNLEALKALLPYYGGQVKCIYIDPPFNTGTEDWIYNDNVNSPEIRKWLGETVGKEAEDLSRHDKWLCMMYPRLMLLKQFLAEDGTIFVSIDDNELDHLLVIMDEIFARKNRLYIATFKQGSATGHKSINPGCVSTTNFVAMYARDKSSWSPNRVYTGRERDKRYSQYIINRDSPCQKWEFTTLAKGFADTIGVSLKEARSIMKDRPSEIDDFVIDHADSVVQLARPDYKGISKDAKRVVDQSEKDPQEIFRLERDGYSDLYIVNGKRILFYRDKLKQVDGKWVAGEPLTTLWDDLLSNNIHAEGGVKFPKGKKPEALIKRVLELVTTEGDVVLDSFGGSGTTGAVAQKLARRWIMVEMHEHAKTHIVPRLRAVTEGEQGGVSKAVQWAGGSGFRFCRLGKPLFDLHGCIDEEVTFADLARHVFFSETGSPIPKQPKKNNPLLGEFAGTAIYLLYNGVLGDKRPDGGNVLTHRIIDELPGHPSGEGPRVVYGEACRLSDKTLAKLGIAFRQIPFELKVS